MSRKISLCNAAIIVVCAMFPLQMQIDAQSLLRPSVVTFGLLYDMTNKILQFDGTQAYAGMKAAEKEINDNDIIGGGVKIRIEFINTPSFFSASQSVVEEAIKNATNGRFGLIMPDWGTSVYLATVIQDQLNSSVPIVAPRLLSTAELDNHNRFSLNLRQPPAVEYLPLAVYAMGSAESRCTAFTVLTRSLFDITPLLDAFEVIGYPRPIAILLPPLTNISNLAINVSAILDTWAASSAGYGGFIPPCGMFFTLPDDAMAILEAMYSDARFDMQHMSFFASALTSESRWNSTSHGTAPFSRVRFVTNFVDPQSTSDKLAVRGRAALKTYLDTRIPSDLPVEYTVQPMLSTLSYPALEGYLAVRWAAEVLSRMPSINQTLFLDAIYARHLFFIDGVTLGPMTETCDEPNTLNLPCFCNVGSSALSIGAINLTTGIADSKAFDSVENQVGHQTLPLSQCFLTAGSLRAPLLVAMWTAWNPTGAAATIYSAFVTLIRQQSVVYNSANQLPSSLISAVVMNDIMPYLPGESNRVYFNRVYATRRPVFMIGEEFLNVSAPIVNVVVSSTVVLEDPPLAAATNFSQYTWNLEAVFADLAHVMSKYIADTYSKQPHRVVVLSDEDASQDLAVKSLHTFQIDPEVPAVRSLATLATMLDLVSDAAATAAAGTRTIVMVASRDPAVFVVALDAVTMIPDAADASSRFAKNFVIVLPASPEFLYQSVVSVNASALQNVPILFPSAFMPFWEPGNAFRVRAASLLNVSTASPILSVSSLYVSIVMFDLFTTLAVAANTQLPFAEDIVSVMYDVSTVTLNGVVLGPVYNATCSTRILASQSAERTCQCYKLLRTYGVYDFRDWLMSTATHQLDYTWTISTCEVTYKPLIVETTLNKGLVAGCATAGGLMFIAAIFYFACCFGRRNNRCAPKNPSEPFAMVFTDIQSSTALWARAPEAMGESLDQHHSMLRHLVLKYNGYEVKTIGDSFMVAFKNATNATQFALAVQTELFAAQWAPDIDDVYIALASEAHEEKMIAEDPKKAEERRMNNIGKLYQWEDTLNYPLNWNGIRVRVGMHWGMGSIKLDPVSQGYDYYGTLVNTAARVEGVGNGGQVLATNDFYVQLEHEQMNLIDVDVKPLGPQPLRGLDQPVPLYQLSPTALRSREFADLRLDVEIDVDTTDSSAHTVSSAPADDTPLILMARLLKHQKNSGPMYDYLTRVLQFMDTLLRTSPIAHRKDALKHYLKKWHVTPRKPRDGKETAEVTLSFDLAALVVRVGLASEEAHGNSSHGSQANKEDAISGRSGLRRKQSYSNVIRVQSVNSYENTAAAPEHPL